MSSIKQKKRFLTNMFGKAWVCPQWRYAVAVGGKKIMPLVVPKVQL